MRRLTVLALVSLAIPATATAGTTRGDQAQKQEQRRASWQCTSRDKDRPVRDASVKAECKVNRPLPPVVDPTPIFLP